MNNGKDGKDGERVGTGIGLPVLALWVAAVVGLAGCGGNDDKAGSGGETPAAATSVTVKGRVTDGRAVSGAEVRLYLAGKSIGSATTDSNGLYAFKLAQGTPLKAGTPLDAVIATKPLPLVGNNVLPEAVAKENAGDITVTNDVSRLTTLTSAVASGVGYPYITAEAPVAGPLAGSRRLAAAMIPTGVPELDELGIARFDVFVPDPGSARRKVGLLLEKLLEELNSEIDTPIPPTVFSDVNFSDSSLWFADLDTVPMLEVKFRMALSGTAPGWEIFPIGSPASRIILGAPETYAPLPPPRLGRGYADTLIVQINACIKGDTASCSALEPNYLHDGMTAAERLASLPAGSVLSSIVELRSLEENERLNWVLGGNSLVQLYFLTPDGISTTWTDVARGAPILATLTGNQSAFPIAIRSFLGRTQLTNAAAVPNLVYENGLEMKIPGTVQFNGGPVPVGSAKVTGPGLPTAGVYLVSADGDRLTLPKIEFTSPWIGCGSCAKSDGLSDQFKWDRRDVQNNVVPGANYDDVRGVSAAPYGLYRVALYDWSGVQIGVTQDVANVGALVSAQNVAATAWPVPDANLIAQFLTPNGSLASAQPSLTVKWSVPEYFTTQFQRLSVQVGSAAQTGQSQFVSAYFADAATTSLVTTNTDYEATLAPVNGVTREELSQQAARQLKMSWGYANQYFTGTWRYEPLR